MTHKLEVGAEVKVKLEGRTGVVAANEDGDILVRFSDGALPRSATFQNSDDELEVIACALQVSAKLSGSAGYCRDDCCFTIGRYNSVGDARGKVEDMFGISWDRILLRDASGVSLSDDLEAMGDLAQDGVVVLLVACLPETVELCIQVSKELGQDEECKIEVRVSSTLDDVIRACLLESRIEIPWSSACLCLANGDALNVNDKIVSILGPSPHFQVPELRLGRAADTAQLAVAFGLGGDEFKFFAKRDLKVADIKHYIEGRKDLRADSFSLSFEGRTLMDDEVLASISIQEQVQLQLVRTGSDVRLIGAEELGEIQCGKFNVQPLATAADLPVHRKCLIEFLQSTLERENGIDEEVLDRCPVEFIGDPVNSADFVKGIVNPPYGGSPISRYTETLAKIYGGTEAANAGVLTVYSWTEDYENPENNFCPEFFDAGLEWWGVYVHTVGNRETGQVGVFLCSITD